MINHFRILDLNPEPWAIGPMGVSRRDGRMKAYVSRNQQLDAYKNAVREAMGDHHEKIEGPVELSFYFWRLRSEYTTPQSARHRKHEADLTNLQKATEDALQGILFDNDRDVVAVASYMVEQSASTLPCIVVGWGSGADVAGAGVRLLPRALAATVESRAHGIVQPTLDEGPDVEDIF